MDFNFALLLFILTVFTGIFWVLDKLIFRRQRQQQARQAVQDFERITAASVETESGPAEVARQKQAIEIARLREPWWIEWTAGFFPVILLVFSLRSFIVEPFQIPSGSMIPTLLVGDFILVNKFTYGIRLPVINKKVISLNDPQRGDVMVFKHPPNPTVDFIKRVVGVPGDVVEYRNKKLTINGKPLAMTPLPDFYDKERVSYAKHFSEKLGNVEHQILNDDYRPPYVDRVLDFPYRDHCEYSNIGFKCKVPAGHYFMMGDNRDNSEDSRVWGFVPDANIVGKAFFVWMNFSDITRIGRFH
ncbi:signal peptidase I [Parvibium lacunae]|uniref:Signal peptidase I n=1 Tax=Parvibium lacunae TaxID=1888893 RepID=A0A368L7E8_9BURK|nr:signal peptidase I [Parvibium lacunae]RCS59546.1 signal peptidase I [Parvibium lacunae]